MPLKDNLDEIKKYVDEGKSQKEIAKILNVSSASVSYLFKKLGLHTKRKSKARPIGQLVKESLRRLRIKVMSTMGGRCVKCGFSDFRALQIDHINGGGTKEVNLIGSVAIQRKILKNPLLINTEYQLLCANCNWIKRSENKEVRRKSI